jgi:uncharacterized protein YndB with AHSA1/START domain
MESATQSKTTILKDLINKSIHISRIFNAPVQQVWSAYTESELLDQWWAPKPWKAETKSMNFTVGGFWLYAMVGPDNTKHWGRMNYHAIQPYQKMEGEDGFCDEDGNLNHDFPLTKWNHIFTATEKGTKVEFKLLLATEKELQTLVEMGFEMGLTAAMDQLDELLA